MKKLSLHIPLERKPEQFPAAEAVVEKVVSLSGAQFSRLRNHPLDDHEEIAKAKPYMWSDGRQAHYHVTVYSEISQRFYAVFSGICCTKICRISVPSLYQFWRTQPW